MKEGLKPRKKHSGNWWITGKVKSHAEFVYLCGTKHLKEFYGLWSALANNERQYTSITIDFSKLKEENLYPDENLFADNFKNEYGQIFGNAMQRAKKMIKKNKDKWHDCFIKHGLICHIGTITPDCFASVETKNISENMWFNLLASERQTLKEMNYKFECWIKLLALNKEHMTNEKDYSLRFSYNDESIIISGPNVEKFRYV